MLEITNCNKSLWMAFHIQPCQPHEAQAFMPERVTFPLNVSLINFTLRIISPNEAEFYMKEFSFTRDSSLRDYTLDLKLNETGMWYWYLSIELHKDDYIDSLEGISLIQYNYESQEFNNNSVVEVLYGEPLDKITLINGIEFPDGFRVYTQSEASQIISARALEKAAKYQQQTAESSEENTEVQQLMVRVLLGTAFVTLIGILISSCFSNRQLKISSKQLALSSKEFEELVKERKRPTVIKIMLSMKITLNEFKEFHEKISKIRNKNKPEEIINLESDFHEKISSKQSNWKDFKRKYSEFHKDIMHYLNDVDEYTRLRNKCKQEIISKIREIEISEDMNKLVKRSQDRRHGTPRQHLDIDLAPVIAESILSKEGIGYLATGERSSELFEKYYDFWMKIREEKPVSECAKELSNKLKDLLKYDKFEKEIEKEIDKLMEDYDISHTELNEYVKVSDEGKND